MKKNFKLLVILLVIVLGYIIFNRSPERTSPESSTEKQLTGSVVDERDGQTYPWVKINNLQWMTKNLAFKTDSGVWSYEDDDANVDVYGYLYNWESALSACPAKWRLPTRKEWDEMQSSLGQDAGGKLKETGTAHWQSPNDGATNASKFTGLPAGANFDGEYAAMGRTGFWWTDTQLNDENAYALYVDHDHSGISWYAGTKTRGLSIRCVK